MFINRFLNLIYKFLDYRTYRKKYKISDGFRFNGYGIRFVGEGTFQSGINSYISYNSYVVLASGAQITIGDNVSISHHVRMYTSGFCTESRIMLGQNVEVIGDIIIGDNVLIGSGCFICPNVTIGNNVVIGANSVVTKDLAGNGVYAGAPAKLIKSYAQS